MKKTTMIIMLALLLCGCEKPLVTDIDEQAEGRHQVTLRLTTVEDNAHWTRSAKNAAEVATRVGVAAFAADGTKAASVNQKESDNGFGTVTLTLSSGSYRLVALAHNCDGTATISSPEKVTFPNNKVTDTFYHYGTLTIDADGNATIDDQDAADVLVLKRCVARFRLILTDEALPAALAQMKFYYMGGSSTFCPQTGWGCVQSKQTELRAVASDDDRVFDIYTMPHESGDVLTRLVVTAQDAEGNTLKERTFTNVPVSVNETTQYEGAFFGSGGTGGSNGGTTLTVDADWGTTTRYSF